MKKLTLFCTMLLIAMTSNAGPRVIGNGGDVYALQFVGVADKLLLYLQSSAPKGLNLTTLAAHIESTSVESTQTPLKLKGLPKDAINYPTEKRIVFDRNRWKSLVFEEKLALVLHEYLGISQQENASYQYSKILLKDYPLVEKIRPGSDSLWLLCQDESLIINSLEHRNGAEGRANDITLILGAYVFQGRLNDSERGEVLLKDGSRNRNFTGELYFNFADRTLYIKGILNLSIDLITIDSTIKCEEKSRP